MDDIFTRIGLHIFCKNCNNSPGHTGVNLYIHTEWNFIFANVSRDLSREIQVCCHFWAVGQIAKEKNG